MRVEYTVEDAPALVAKRIMTVSPLWRESEVPTSLSSEGIQGVEVRAKDAGFEFVTLCAHLDIAVPTYRFRGRIESIGTGTRITVQVHQRGLTEASAIGAGIIAAIELPRGGPAGNLALVVGVVLLVVSWRRNQHLSRRAHPLLELLFARLELALRPAAG